MGIYSSEAVRSRRVCCIRACQICQTDHLQPFRLLRSVSEYGMRIFHSFSRNGKIDSNGVKPLTLTLQQAMPCLLSVLSSGSPLALRTERQRSLALTPTPSATLSVLSSGSPLALRTERQRSLALTPIVHRLNQKGTK